MIIKALQILLYVLFIGTAIFLYRDIWKKHKDGKFEDENMIKPLFTGFITNFLDTLGIGSFAPTVFLFKALKHNVKDKEIPATLNAADALPVLAEAIVFIQATKVEPITLVSLLFAAALGAYLGAGVVAKAEERKIQIFMGFALLVAAGFFVAGMIGIMPVGGTALGLHGVKLIVAIIIFFILGALMTAGIGLYAPSMVVVYSMGMSPAAAFPIMMGSCALLMPAATVKFVKEDSYAKKNTLWISLGGLVGVFIAANFVKSLPLEKLKILVVIVVVVTAFMMLKSGLTAKKTEKQQAE